MSDKSRILLKSPVDPKRPLILIAEDKELNMIVSRNMVKKLYPEAVVIEAVNGEIAVQQTKRKKPDLILMDIKMPVMDGIEAIRAIREYEKDVPHKTPILALTAETEEEGVLNYIELGISDIIAKPTQLEIMEKKLKRIIK